MGGGWLRSSGGVGRGGGGDIPVGRAREEWVLLSCPMGWAHHELHVLRRELEGGRLEVEVASCPQAKRRVENSQSARSSHSHNTRRQQADLLSMQTCRAEMDGIPRKYWHAVKFPVVLTDLESQWLVRNRCGSD